MSLKARAMLQAERMVHGLGVALEVITERVEREPARLAYSAELRRREKLNRVRVRQLRDGEDAPALTGADLKLLAKADAIEATAIKGKRGAPSIRATAAKLRDVVGDALIARGEARRADLRLVQTVGLEAVREGEAPDQVIEARRGQVQKRIRTRDGLKLLHERGGLSGGAGASGRMEADRLLAAGLRYRDLFELAAASLKSCLDVGDGTKRGSQTSVYDAAKRAHRRAALANQVRRLEMAVAAGLGPDAVDVLRKVAGEARTVNSLRAGGEVRKRLTARLVAALKIIADKLGQGA